MAELRQSYDLLIMKVLSLLQDDDQRLASAIVASREAIWGLLSDQNKFATLKANTGEPMNRRTAVLIQSLVVLAVFAVPSFAAGRGSAQKGPDGGDRASGIAVRPGRRRQGAGPERLRRDVQGRTPVSRVS